MKPIIKYRGGKSKEIPNFIQFIPQNYDRYVEPFLGGAALYFYLEPHTALINDINDKLINFYLSVRNNFNALRKELTSLETTYRLFANFGAHNAQLQNSLRKFYIKC